MKKSVSFPHRSAYLRLIALWVLRAFSPGLGRSRYFSRRMPMDDDIGGFIGVPVDGPDGPVPPAEVGYQLDALHAKLEASRPQPRLTAVQRGNFACLGELLGLNAIEIELLQYLSCALIDPILQDTHQRIGRVFHAKPITVRKASELLSPYVGMTEQNIGQSFERAAEDGAVLVIDEVDSFLRDRRHAQHSWEVTQVNEMLTRIESFPGILIASTNLIDGLDQASLRRFDLKLHFDYLQPGQSQRLFAAHCHKLGFGKLAERELAAAAELVAATPGDFAAVARRHNFQPVHSPADLLERLREEIQHKLPGLRRIGFCQ